jgi:hypothetical protein
VYYLRSEEQHIILEGESVTFVARQGFTVRTRLKTADLLTDTTEGLEAKY